MVILTTPLKKKEAGDDFPASSRRQLMELTTTRTSTQNVRPKTTNLVINEPQSLGDRKERPNVDRQRSAQNRTTIPENKNRGRR